MRERVGELHTLIGQEAFMDLSAASSTLYDLLSLDTHRGKGGIKLGKIEGREWARMACSGE